ncbi:MAG TPA: L-rhamnose isomerase [Phycisphaerae bacterium]|nr:L-rhamnose isomerase [Phycisphaerae bacterium]HRW53386.1 L-rhamnose isomerase [Phycisphaerae bacterium]
MNLPSHVSEAAIAARLDRFEIETPSWGYADTGTRFGKFTQAAAASTLEEKLTDAAEVHRHTGCCPSVAVHVLWDFSEGVDPQRVARRAAELGVRIGSINPNVFQDQRYKLGSVTHADAAIRRQAIDHMIDSIRIGERVGSKLLSLWFADGTNYPGQAMIRQRKRWFADALRDVHSAMPADMRMLVEYKPFEPAFYHTDVADWGMAQTFARHAGDRAKVLVDTGHHLPGANIEHIVAFLLDEDMLGGFHFNDRKYADDDLTMGSIDPYQLFRIFYEITAWEFDAGRDADIAYMIDQSHNLKPKIEAMIQTVVTAQEHFTKALLVDHAALRKAQAEGDIVAAERTLRDAYYFDVRPFLSSYRQGRRVSADPLQAYRDSGYAERVATERAPNKPASTSQYA